MLHRDHPGRQDRLRRQPRLGHGHPDPHRHQHRAQADQGRSPPRLHRVHPVTNRQPGAVPSRGPAPGQPEVPSVPDTRVQARRGRCLLQPGHAGLLRRTLASHQHDRTATCPGDRPGGYCRTAKVACPIWQTTPQPESQDPDEPAASRQRPPKWTICAAEQRESARYPATPIRRSARITTRGRSHSVSGAESSARTPRARSVSIASRRATTRDRKELIFGAALPFWPPSGAARARPQSHD